MNSDQYYIAPSDAIFGDIKRAAIRVWKTYDDTYKYATNKINGIKDIPNFKDNYGFIIAGFDYQNQNRLVQSLERQDSIEFVTDLLQWSRSQL